MKLQHVTLISHRCLIPCLLFRFYIIGQLLASFAAAAFATTYWGTGASLHLCPPAAGHCQAESLPLT